MTSEAKATMDPWKMERIFLDTFGDRFFIMEKFEDGTDAGFYAGSTQKLQSNIRLASQYKTEASARSIASKRGMAHYSIVSLSKVINGGL